MGIFQPIFIKFCKIRQRIAHDKIQQCSKKISRSIIAIISRITISRAHNLPARYNQKHGSVFDEIDHLISQWRQDNFNRLWQDNITHLLRVGESLRSRGFKLPLWDREYPASHHLAHIRAVICSNTQNTDVKRSRLFPNGARQNTRKIFV